MNIKAVLHYPALRFPQKPPENVACFYHPLSFIMFAISEQFFPQHIVSWNELTCHVCSCQVGLAAFATYGPLLFPWVPVGPDGGTSRTSHKWNAIMAQNCLTASGLAICKPRGWHIPRSKYPNQTWTTNFCPHWHLVYIYILYIYLFCHIYIYMSTAAHNSASKALRTWTGREPGFNGHIQIDTSQSILISLPISKL